MDETAENKELLNIKQQEEFTKNIHNTYNLIKRDTEYIPATEELNDANKGLWIEHDDSDFAKVFNGLLDYTNDDDELDNLDWNSVNYEVYGADYYAERFPGFSDEIYEILAKSTEPDSKIVDHRVPPLKITNGPVTVSFD